MLSGMVCGNFFQSSACPAAWSATRGSGPWAAALRYVVSSNSNHSVRQSVMIFLPDRHRTHKYHAPCPNRDWRMEMCSEMLTQVAEASQDEQPAGSAANLFASQGPGGRMRDEYRIQACFERRVNITARAVASHPSPRFHDVVPVHHGAVGRHIFLRHDLNRLKMNLQAGPLDLGRLFRRFAFREQDQAMTSREIIQCFDNAVQDAGRRALNLADAEM